MAKLNMCSLCGYHRDNCVAIKDNSKVGKVAYVCPKCREAIDKETSKVECDTCGMRTSKNNAKEVYVGIFSRDDTQMDIKRYYRMCTPCRIGMAGYIETAMEKLGGR